MPNTKFQNNNTSEYLNKFVPLILEDSDNPSSINSDNVIVIYWQQRTYWRTPTTSDSVDGVRVIQTSNGVKYTMIQFINPASVEAIQNDPPANPDDGDIYILGAAPTGVWATDSGADPGNFAIYSAANDSWVYLEPRYGDKVSNYADDLEYRRNKMGEWIGGISGVDLAINSVPITSIKNGPLIIRGIFNNVPQGTGDVVGIIGDTPTAGTIFEGREKEIFIRRGLVYTYIEIPDLEQGQVVFDRSTNPMTIREWTGTEWIAKTVSGPMRGYKPVEVNIGAFSSSTDANNRVSSPTGAVSPELFSAMLDDTADWVEVSITEPITVAGEFTFTSGTPGVLSINYKLGMLVYIGDTLAFTYDVPDNGSLRATMQPGTAYNFAGSTGNRFNPFNENVMLGETNYQTYKIANAQGTRNIRVVFSLFVFSSGSNNAGILNNDWGANAAIKFTNISAASGTLTIKQFKADP